MNQQRGMTLVELMISMVLSLTLISGISSLFVQMQKSNKVQRAVSGIADEGNYVLEVLQKEIRRTGGLRSRSDVNGTASQIFKARANVLVNGLSFLQTEYIKGDATSPINDAFILRYQLLDTQDLSFNDPSNGSSPCTQNLLLDAGENPAIQEHVVSLYLYLNGNKLSCTAQREMFDLKAGVSTPACIKNCTSATNFTPVDTSIELVSNVVRFIMKYGIDADGDNAADYYVDAASVATGAEPANLWNDIVSVRISLVMRSAEDHLVDAPMTYYLEGVLQTPTDYRLYKSFTTTIALRNRLL